MDIAAFKKHIDLKLENRRKKQEIRKKIQDYNDVKQGLAIQREEQFKPIVDEVKQVKETIDEKQDRLIQKLDENQKALTEDLSLLRELDTFESPPESPTALEPPPKPKFKIPDPHTGFSQDELTYIQKSGYLTPNEAYNQLLDETFDSSNSSIQLRNETIEILDHLLKNNKISKEHYSAYIQKYFT